MKKTLAYRLVFAVTALVTAITLALGTASVIATYQIMIRQADARLAAVGDPQVRPGRGGPGRNVEGFGVAMGTISVDLSTNPPTGAILTPRGAAVLDESSVTELVTRVGNPPISLRLGEHGWYRARLATKDGNPIIAAIPLRELTSTLTWLLLTETLLALAIVTASFFATRRIVRVQLQPLNRLAGAANQVSNLDLATGDVQLPRIAAADCEPQTEVGQVGLSFNHMLDNVEGALLARQRSETQVRQFVADASHELRNPLAAIRGYAELTQRDLELLPEPTQNALTRIDSESRRMSALVEDLLLLARLDNQPTLTLAPVNVGDLLAGAVSDAQAAGSEHEWSLSLPTDEIWALADEHRLAQVAANLLGNARSHTPPGTQVTTSLALDGPWAVIAVHDNGPGIAPELLPTVFERFTRGESHRARHQDGQSTGLGLAIVAAVVQAMGGRVQVASTPGSTTFTVQIPTTSPKVSTPPGR